MNEIAKPGNQLAEWHEREDVVSLVKRTLVPAGVTDDEFRLFLETCRNLGLNPVARQAYCIKRYDKSKNAYVAQTQVSIDGFRLVASRSGQYRGQEGPFWCGQDGVWRDVWTGPGYPAAAKVGVLRDGFSAPVWGVALWGEYVQTGKDGQPTPMWRQFATTMLAKCAEMAALRKAFPAELAGCYGVEEMSQAAAVPAMTAEQFKGVADWFREIGGTKEMYAALKEGGVAARIGEARDNGCRTAHEVVAYLLRGEMPKADAVDAEVVGGDGQPDPFADE